MYFSILILAEKLSGDPARTVAALDLGGGSTQVTFAATTPASLKQKDNIHDALTPRGLIPVYTHSFTGLGLMAARHAVVTLGQPDKHNVTSLCVNPIVKGRKFNYHGKLPVFNCIFVNTKTSFFHLGTAYYVSGLQDHYPTSRVKSDGVYIEEVVPIVSFYDCSKIITDYVMNKAKPPEELPLKTIFAFSYYFDRASDVGLIGKIFFATDIL